MSLPISLYGNEYLEHLRGFRDRALVESRWMGKRRNIGRFSVGIAHAQWRAENGGIAHLTDEGVRLKGATIFKYLPTTLEIISPPAETGFEVVTYKMDIDDIGRIDIYRNLMSSGSFKEIALAELHRRADRKYGLSDPTDEQRELLYTEMQRGSTGLYPVNYSQED